MSNTAKQQAEEMGRKSAKATHRNHDAALARNTREYFSRWLYSQPETERKELVQVFNAAYQEESGYYIGTHLLTIACY